MRTILFSLLINIIFSSAKAQSTIPKHYINVFGGAEWNTLSVTVGGEYEYMLSFNGKNMLSIKGFAVLPYELGNFELITNSGYEGRAYRAAVLCSGNFYLNKNNDAKGLYFTVGGGLGLAGVKDKIHHNNGYSYDFNSHLNWAAETGAGLQFAVDKKIHIRLSLTTKWGVFIGGYTAGQISIGF